MLVSRKFVILRKENMSSFQQHLLVRQFAKLLGCYVVGSAGSKENVYSSCIIVTLSKSSLVLSSRQVVERFTFFCLKFAKHACSSYGP